MLDATVTHSAHAPAVDNLETASVENDFAFYSDKIVCSVGHLSLLLRALCLACSYDNREPRNVFGDYA